ncbi:MAG: hypothetical protein NVS3B20_22210 [Polyangiales bacterium]
MRKRFNVTVFPLRTEADCAAAIARPQAFAPPTPVQAILFRLEQGTLSRKSLEGIIGSRARVSEVLSGTRPLTLPRIRRLHAQLGIFLESLLG